VAGGIDAPTGLEMLRRLEADHLIDFVNVIRGYIASDAELIDVIPIHGMPSAPHLDFAGMVRQSTGLPVLHASKVDDVATARHAIREGKVDLVGMTRAHLADPHIVRKLLDGREAEILFAGEVPGNVGLVQVNAKLPGSMAGALRPVPVVLRVGGRSSQAPVLVWLAQ
jgi:2,4-dienoyl-CoA reductase-like NADH-dependent reductase (Old Yellow Enzyme family)